MGQGFRSPAKPGKNRVHTISDHAIKRFREYGTDVGRSAQEEQLGDILDEVLQEALANGEGEHCIDVEGEPGILIPLDRPLWAAPGLFLMVRDAGKTKVVKTLLTEGTVTKMKDANRMVKLGELLPAALSQALLAEGQEELRVKREVRIKTEKAKTKEAVMIPTPDELYPDIRPDVVFTEAAPLSEKEQIELLRRQLGNLQHELQQTEARLQAQVELNQLAEGNLQALERDIQELKGDKRRMEVEHSVLRRIEAGKIEQMEIAIGLVLDRVLDRLK